MKMRYLLILFIALASPAFAADLQLSWPVPTGDEYIVQHAANNAPLKEIGRVKPSTTIYEITIPSVPGDRHCFKFGCVHGAEISYGAVTCFTTPVGTPAGPGVRITTKAGQTVTVTRRKTDTSKIITTTVNKSTVVEVDGKPR
jgi:hypothetical protein